MVFRNEAVVLSELFRKATGDAGIEERIGPGSPWWGEHVARYELALTHVEGKTVLDAACGAGYGTTILQSRAKWVTGVDLDEAAIAATRRSIDPARGEVIRADATRLSFDDGHFDVVTSFETLEHLPDRPAFLREMARLLAPGGLLLLSTPNARYTRPIDGKPRNPFHLFEYLPHELRAELSPWFSDVTLLGQSLDARFVVPPFAWDARFVSDPMVKVGCQLRRAAYRLPPGTRDAIAQLLWGHDFFPRADDYHFAPEIVDDAPVLFALCRVASLGRARVEGARGRARS